MNRGSVRELEERNAMERKELMRALFENLTEKGIKSELRFERAENCFGEEVLEPVVYLENQNLNRIRLVGLDSGSCGVSGEILRFQYEISLDKELTAEAMSNIKTYTGLIKEGKILKYLGGKVTGIKWFGQKLAENLNRDQSIIDDLMRCVESWSHMEFQIEAVSPQDVFITGPRFSEPGLITTLYHSEIKDEVQCCAFGFNTVEKIAGHVKNDFG